MGNDQTGYIGDSSFGKLFKGKPVEGYRDIINASNQEQNFDALFGTDIQGRLAQGAQGSIDQRLQGDTASQNAAAVQREQDKWNTGTRDAAALANSQKIMGDEAALQRKNTTDAARTKEVQDADLSATMSGAEDKAARAKRGRSKLYEDRLSAGGGF